MMLTRPYNLKAEQHDLLGRLTAACVSRSRSPYSPGTRRVGVDAMRNAATGTPPGVNRGFGVVGQVADHGHRGLA